MDGLQVSAEISKLSHKIDALKRILMKVESDRDFNYECRVLRELQKELEVKKSALEDKLRSVTF